jgi:hypothetical protein
MHCASSSARSNHTTPQPEPHTAELYAERDWYSLANSDQLGRLTNDQLKVGRS